MRQVTALHLQCGTGRGLLSSRTCLLLTCVSCVCFSVTQSDVMFRQKYLFICVSVVLVVSVAEADYPPERELPATSSRQRPEVVTCEQRASCGVDNANARLPFYTRNCFCDALCRTYDDCCADFRPESAETGNSLPNLPRSVISCARVEEIDTAYEIYIVTKCPRGFSDAFIRDRCEDERIAGEFYRLPVSGVTSGVLYRNAYCAMCANETAYLFWRMAHLCVRVAGHVGGAPDVRQMMRCPPELLAPEVSDDDATAVRLRPRKCKSHVAQCEPRRRSKGGRTRRRCRGPTSYVYDGLEVFNPFQRSVNQRPLSKGHIILREGGK